MLMTFTIVLDERVIQKKYFFLLLHENICCGYSLDVPHRGASNEYMYFLHIHDKIRTQCSR